MATSRNLSPILKKLLEHHGEVAGPAIDDPFHLVLWEQVAYLADDERRRDAFQLLACRVGLSPEEILRARLTRRLTEPGRPKTEKASPESQAFVLCAFARELRNPSPSRQERKERTLSARLMT